MVVSDTTSGIDVNFLLSQKKIVITKDGRSLYEEINFNRGSSFRYDIALEDDLTENPKFFLQIFRSSKRTIQLTLHFQEKMTCICLVRIDFNPGAQHTNPPCVAAGTEVPQELAAYAGQTIVGSHIHHHVEGYRPSAWAMPIEDTAFPVKCFNGQDFVNSFNQIITAFSAMINLETRIRHIDVLPI